MALSKGLSEYCFRVTMVGMSPSRSNSLSTRSSHREPCFQSWFAKIAAAFVVLGTTLPSTGLGESWTEFRGPTGQGISSAKRLPTEWTDSKNVAWKRGLEGSGWSSPVIEKGRLYFTSAMASGEGSTPSLHVLCFDTATGSPLWDKEVFSSVAGAKARIHQKNTDASATPILSDGRLYVHFGHLGTACLDLEGKVLWRNNSIQYSPVHGNGGSPALVGDLVVFSCDGASDPFVVALDRKTGELRWKTPRTGTPQKRFSFSTPLVIQVGGESQIISPGSGAVFAYSPKDGSELWKARYGEGYSVVPRPVFGHGMVFLSSGFDRPATMAIKVDGRGDVTDTHVVWSISRSAPNTPSMILDGKELYFVSDSGIATCADAVSGKVHWSERLGGNFSASPILAGGRVYFQNEEGAGFVVQAGTTYQLLASNDLKERTLASPAVEGNALFLRGEKHLFRIESTR